MAATEEQLDRLVSATLALISTTGEILGFSDDMPNARQRAGVLVLNEAEYKAALEDVAASA